MLNYTRIIALLFLVVNFSFVSGQVKVTKSEVDYSLKTEQDSIIRILTLWKDLDSTVYTSIKYSISDFNQTENTFNLKNEISTIQKLWDIAEDSIEFELRSFNIGYPLLYQDILKNHIQAFVDSKEWQDHVKLYGKKLDYQIIKKVMVEANVYKPLNEFLKSKGYYITGVDTEKHGFVTKEKLQKAGFSGNEIIPMPFIIWLTLDKLK